MIDLRQGDCLGLVKDIPDGSIDMVMTDPPYGTTACKWDSIIPLNSYVMVKKGKKMVPMYEDEWVLSQAYKSYENVCTLRDEFKQTCQLGMWDHLKRIIKPDGAIVMTGNEPFSSSLRLSNIKNYKYDWKWDKVRGSNFATVKIRPFNNFEDIMVFYKKQPVYNPQMWRSTPYKQKQGFVGESKQTGLGREDVVTESDGCRYPLTIIRFSKEAGIHPTQKPVVLMEYLIRTYTNENETVLDFASGSFTTAIACMNTNRSFIGIELDEKYFQIGVDRVAAHNETLGVPVEVIVNRGGHSNEKTP